MHAHRVRDGWREAGGDWGKHKQQHKSQNEHWKPAHLRNARKVEYCKHRTITCGFRVTASRDRLFRASGRGREGSFHRGAWRVQCHLIARQVLCLCRWSVKVRISSAGRRASFLGGLLAVWPDTHQICRRPANVQRAASFPLRLCLAARGPLILRDATISKKLSGRSRIEMAWGENGPQHCNATQICDVGREPWQVTAGARRRGDPSPGGSPHVGRVALPVAGGRPWVLF